MHARASLVTKVQFERHGPESLASFVSSDIMEFLSSPMDEEFDSLIQSLDAASIDDNNYNKSM